MSRIIKVVKFIEEDYAVVHTFLDEISCEFEIVGVCEEISPENRWLFFCGDSEHSARYEDVPNQEKIKGYVKWDGFCELDIEPNCSCFSFMGVEDIKILFKAIEYAYTEAVELLKNIKEN